MFKRLFLFVEGPDDERFCRAVAEPMLKLHFQEIKYINFANRKPADIEKFLKSIPRIPHADYIFMHDLDEHPCVTACKQKLIKKFSNALLPDQAIIAKQEIESWYLAGIPKENCKKLKLKFLKDTQKVNKEKFNTLIPLSFIRTDFMVELLKTFSIEEAKSRNDSFCYFCDKHLSEKY